MSTGPASITTDVRCPTGAQSLLSRIVSTDGKPLPDLGNFLLQTHCRECTKDFRRIHGTESVLRVLHHYTTSGEFVNTVIQFRDGEDKEIDLSTQIEIFRLSVSFKKGR